jgi:lysophospholipase L1-like esterase
MTTFLLSAVFQAELRIVAFGDSTTAPRSTVERVYADRLESKLAAAGMSVDVINAGVGGNTTAAARRRFAPDVLGQEPDAVVIQFGLNDSSIDVWKGATEPRVSLADYRKNLKFFVDVLQARSITPVLMTPNPGFWKGGLEKRYGKAPYDASKKWGFNHVVSRYAGAVRELAAAEGIDLIDVYAHYESVDAAEDLLVDGLHPGDSGHEVVAAKLAELDWPGQDKVNRGYTIPIVDLDQHEEFHVVVDREEGQYLGHPTTVLLEDGKTILTVYPKGHGRGGIVYKRSDDGGKTWSDRIPTPDSWMTSKEVPTLHRVIDPKTGKKRLIMWSGLYPARLAVSEDDGANWSELESVGDWGGIVVMGCLEQLKDGRYVALFHDDGRFFKEGGKRVKTMTLYQTFSSDGGMTWSFPEEIFKADDVALCEPGIIRSPDGNQLCVLLRENSRTKNSHVIFSDDEAKTWTKPRELPGSLTGDRHTAQYTPDGRLFISFRDTTLESKTKGDWVGWVGTYEDIVEGREGQYRVRLKDNKNAWDCAYPGVLILPDGTIVSTTYGHWDEGKQPYIRTVRFKIEDIDRLAKG